MKVDKGRILDLLNERGETDKVAQAERELPVVVDLKADHDALAELGLDRQVIEGYLATHRDAPLL